jgi:hypothetical protein
VSLQSDLASLLRAGGADILEEGPLQIRIGMEGIGSEAELSLSNLRIRIGREPEDRGQLLQSFADSALRSLLGASEGMLLPKILPWTADSSLSAPWHRPLVEGALRLSLCEDLGDRIRKLQPMDIHRLGMGLEDAVSLSVSNLRRLSAGVEPVLEDDGTLVFETGDGLDASRVLLLQDYVQESALVAMPGRDSLWIIPGREATDRLRWQLRRAYASLPYALSPQLFRWHGGSLSLA